MIFNFFFFKINIFIKKIIVIYIIILSSKVFYYVLEKKVINIKIKQTGYSTISDKNEELSKLLYSVIS